MTKSGEPFPWSAEQETARKYIIEQCQLFCVFDPELPTELYTDSRIDYGRVLLQNSERNLREIGNFGKKTKNYEEKYHSYELESLAVVNSMGYFRIYLLGIRFTMVTDCNAIKSIAAKKEILP